VIADRIGLYVNEIYDHPGSYQGIPVVLAVFFFALQVYCDFSGYSNIAMGTARVMGFDLVTNFNLPFSSKSVTEFWRRWHMSLTTWFNDYLYTPFVLRHREWGVKAIVLGLLLTFFISGLWHGAAWTFVIFGVLHGIAVIFELLTKKTRKSLSAKFPSWFYGPLCVLITFSFVACTLVFFRANTFADAITVFRNLLPHRMPLNAIAAPFGYETALFNKIELLVSFLMIFILYAVQHFEKKMPLNAIAARVRSPMRWLFYYGFVVIIILFGSYSDRMEFIYFQF
jgi:D-alanyl-lipoteichoic acid acyltransferase DltB (MBOAT superfamily)